MREKGGFRQKKGKWVTPTITEINNEIKRKMDYETQEILLKINCIEFDWVNLKLIESRLLFRQKQLGLDKQGNNIASVKVQEFFNGVIKPKEMLSAEYDLDIHTYKKLVGEIEASIRFLKEKGFTDEQIKDIKLNKFDYVGWHEKNCEVKGVVDVERPSGLG